MTFGPIDFNAPFEVNAFDLEVITSTLTELGSAASLIDKRERSAFILSASSYCSRCGHRESYHQGSGCNYDDCWCTGWMPEAKR